MRSTTDASCLPGSNLQTAAQPQHMQVFSQGQGQLKFFNQIAAAPTVVPSQHSGFHLPRLRPINHSARARASPTGQVAVAWTSTAFALQSKGDDPLHRIRLTTHFKIAAMR